jgi:hypothetical protein
LDVRRIEQRKREVTADEMCVLAMAMDMSPMDLMAPVTSATTGEIKLKMRGGNVEMAAPDFREWVRGDGAFAAEVPEPGMRDLFQMLIFGLGSQRATTLLMERLVIEALVPRPCETQIDAFRRVSAALVALAA